MSSPLVFSRGVILTSLLAAGVVVPARGQSSPANRGSGMQGFCASDPDQPVAYFSEIFDTGLSQGIRFSTFASLQSEFMEYLKGRYDYKSNSNYPISCPATPSAGQAASSKGALESQMRQAGKQIVEVVWNFTPDEASVAAMAVAEAGTPPVLRPAPEIWCAVQPAEGTVYLSGVAGAVGITYTRDWSDGFTQFVAGKYSFKGRAFCVGGGRGMAERLWQARLAGLHAAGRNAVETGWKYDSAAAASSAPAPRPSADEDREPPRPAPGVRAGSTDARKLAAKEGPAVQKYCLRDRTLSVVFDCIRIRRAVYSYRLAHPAGTPESFATLFTGDKLDCTECLDNFKPPAWAKRTALAARLKAPVANCVSKEFVDRLKARPYPNRVQEHYDAAVAACTR